MNQQASDPAETTESLTLVDDSNLVGPKRFGELVASKQGRPEPYTSQSVANWCKDGRAEPAKVDDRGWKLFDPAHAETVAKNIPQPSRGGSRRGSGRKRTKRATKQASTNASQNMKSSGDQSPDTAGEESLADRMEAIERGQNAVEAWKTRIAEDDPLPPSEAMEISETLSWTEDEFKAAMAVFTVGRGGLSPAMMSVLETWMKIRERKQKYDKEAGKLVEQDTVREIVSLANAPVVEMLDTLGRDLTQRLSPRCWIKIDLVDEIIGTLHRELAEAGADPNSQPIRGTLDTLRASLSRPPGLDAAIRATVEQIVDAARRTLVERITETDSAGELES